MLLGATALPITHVLAEEATGNPGTSMNPQVSSGARPQPNPPPQATNAVPSPLELVNAAALVGTYQASDPSQTANPEGTANPENSANPEGGDPGNKSHPGIEGNSGS